MENLLFKEIVKFVFVFVCPLAILSLLFFDQQPWIALAFAIGALLGILRLKAFFSYIASILNSKESSKNIKYLTKYLASLILTFVAIGFVLLKSVIIGLAILFGLITVPVMLMIYTAIKGIALYRKK